MTSTQSPLGPHMVRYGISGDQKYLTGEFLETYDTLVINGNMVAHIPAALAEFVGTSITSDSGVKPFVIDPQTHAFQHNPRQTELKSSLKKMSEAFGEPVKSRFGEFAVVPDDFKDPAVQRSFCQRVVDFQLNTINEQAREKGFMKYLSFIGIPAMSPACVVAPYLWMEPDTLQYWIELNASFIDMAQEFAQGQPVYAQMVLGQDVILKPESVKALCDKYGATSCEGVFVWIDRFDECAMSYDHLLGFATLAKGLSQQHGKKVINLYAGYLSVLFCQLPELKQVLQGACHGLEYGEERGVVPVGGGIPRSRFYLRPYHQRLRFDDAVRAIRDLKGFSSADSFFDKVCSCPVCTQEILDDPVNDFSKYGESRPVQVKRGSQVVTLNYPTPATKGLCLRHYLYNKQREFKEATALTAAEAARDLGELQPRAARLLGTGDAAYLGNWARLIGELSSSGTAGP